MICLKKKTPWNKYFSVQHSLAIFVILKTKLFMKRIFIFAVSALTVSFSSAQTAKIKGQNLGVQFTLHDYKTASEIDTKGASFVLGGTDWKKLSRMRPGLAVTYTEGLNDHFDFNARLGFSYLEYTLANKPFAPSTGSKPYFEADANLFMKLTTDDYWVSPFLSLGAGASNWNGYYAAYIPVGAGLQVNLYDLTYFVIQTQYRAPVTANASNNLFYSFGIAANIGRK